jgi:hypothetical protein
MDPTNMAYPNKIAAIMPNNAPVIVYFSEIKLDELVKSYAASSR